MGWYVLNCRAGQEEKIVQSCRRNIPSNILETAFFFRCERLWRSGGAWKPEEKRMFPGYVFLQSSSPGELSKKLEQYRNFSRLMEEPGYLISVYEEEEKILRQLCGEDHCLKMSYGYKENCVDYVTAGPLKGLENRILRIDWHRRFAQLKIPVSGQKKIVWAGIALDIERAAKKKSLVS